jgi:hypothetical protein
MSEITDNQNAEQIENVQENKETFITVSEPIVVSHYCMSKKCNPKKEDESDEEKEKRKLEALRTYVVTDIDLTPNKVTEVWKGKCPECGGNIAKLINREKRGQYVVNQEVISKLNELQVEA